MVTRALLLFGLIAGVSVGAILATVQLPEIPLLRYAVLAAPLIGALVVVVGWLDADALGASHPVRARRLASAPTEARIVQRGRRPEEMPAESGR
jgi:hypothetical protein